MCLPACEAMPGHAGGRPCLLSDQQELRQRPAGARTPVVHGQHDGGDKTALTQSSELLKARVKEDADENQFT